MKKKSIMMGVYKMLTKNMANVVKPFLEVDENGVNFNSPSNPSVVQEYQRN